MDEKEICILVKELQPLYKDEILTEPCRHTIEQHLAICEECATFYENTSELSFDMELPFDESEEDEETETKIYTSLAKKMRRKKWLGYFCFMDIIVVLLSVYHLLFCLVTFEGGNNMAPTISHGETCLIQKTAYLWSTPDYNDLIFYKVETENGSVAYCDIGRVVALPGDTIEFRDGYLYVNGKKNSMYKNIAYAGDNLTIPKDAYYVLGDNINTAYDSRYIGCIAQENIRGKCILHTKFPNLTTTTQTAATEQH